MNLQTWQTINQVTDKDLASRINVDASLLSHYKAGRRRFSPQNALRIEQATGGAVTRMELLYPDELLQSPQADETPANQEAVG
jgi:DNA-binding transcriptional regulator YdaS (Cro superfamily)